jgi:PST family polysaccharide transporter
MPSKVKFGSLPAPAVAQKIGDLDGTLVRGLAWTGGVKWSAQLVAWASTLIVARLLTPDDYGLVGMATVYLGLVNLISECGVGTTVVTLRDLTHDQIAQLNGFAVLLGFAGFTLSGLAAVPLAVFFKSPRLASVVISMSTTFIISSFQSVPIALLQKDLRFKLISLIDGTRAFILSFATVIFALAGLGYWTLVTGAILSTLLGTLLILSRRRHQIAWPRPRTLRLVLRFSGHILVSRLSWYAYSNSDFIISGRVLGQQALGAYTVAWNMSNVPVEKVTGVLNNVATALFSAVQKDKASLRRYLLTLTEGIALITFPASVGLGMVAPEFVTVVLGQKWQAAVAPLRFLAFYVTLRSITPLIPIVLNATGESHFNMWNSVAAAVILPIAFYGGSHWGNAGIAAAWMLAYPLVAFPLYLRAFRRVELPWMQYVGVLLPAISGSIVMAAVLSVVRSILPTSYALGLRLFLLVLAGVAAYLAVAGSLNFRQRHRLTKIMALLRAPAAG